MTADQKQLWRIQRLWRGTFERLSTKPTTKSELKSKVQVVDSTSQHPDIITMTFRTHLTLVRVRFGPFPQWGDALLQLTRLRLLVLRLCFRSGVQRWQLKQEQQVSISGVSPTIKTGKKCWNKDLKHKMHQQQRFCWAMWAKSRVKVKQRWTITLL